MKNTTLIAGGLLASALIATPALAHPGHLAGHMTGLAGGFVHPFTGLDHLAAMLAVGAWSATRTPARAWVAPALFMALLVVGGLLGVRFGALAGVEPMTALSVAALGGLLLAAPLMRDGVGLGVIGAAALIHGAAHGVEAVGSLTGYFAGFVAASALLHLAGWAFGRQMFGTRAARIVSGLALGATGIALAAF